MVMWCLEVGCGGWKKVGYRPSLNYCGLLSDYGAVLAPYRAWSQSTDSFMALLLMQIY